MSSAVELRTTPGRGEGIFALKSFQRGDTVLVGVLDDAPVKNHSHASQLGKSKFGFHKGLSSKFNHSCDPNCGIRLNDKGGHDVGAICDIAASAQATYDYAMRNYRIEYFPGICACGAAECRGAITGWKDLPEHRKVAYDGFVAPYLLEMDLYQIADHSAEIDPASFLANFRMTVNALQQYKKPPRKPSATS